MKNALIKLLEDEFKLPVFLQGTMNPAAAYPESFFTIWNDDTNGAAYYDNDARAFVWDFTIALYSSDPAAPNTILPQLRTLLRANGWTVRGVGYDVASDEPTHTGRAINAAFIEIPTQEENLND